MLLLADHLRLAAEGLLSMVAGSLQVAANWYTAMVAYQMWSMNVAFLTRILSVMAGC